MPRGARVCTPGSGGCVVQAGVRTSSRSGGCKVGSPCSGMAAGVGGCRIRPCRALGLRRGVQGTALPGSGVEEVPRLQGGCLEPLGRVSPSLGPCQGHTASPCE